MTADLHLISAETNASVSAVCRTLELPRSSYYARRTRTPSRRALDTRTLDVQIAAVFREHKGRYGSPRVHRVLRATRPVSKKRVAARMQVLGLQARRPRRFRRTSLADPSKAPASNVLARRFRWPRKNQAWAGDITYVWTKAGWAYLALLVDLCTRTIVGWSVSERCDTALAVRALNNAVARHQPDTGLLHHTDRGATYTANDYRARLRELGMVSSMSRRGNCWDNAVAESTIGTIKAELLSTEVPADVPDLRASLFQYIEAYYNRTRLHSTLKYRTPAEVESITSARGSRAA